MQHARAFSSLASSAFTLSELLICLVILGVIATFSIPKVLQAQQGGQYNAMAKEVAGMVSGALQVYKSQHDNSAVGMHWTDLTSYLNYVDVDTISSIDFNNDGTTRDCFAANKLCLRMHNGGILQFDTSNVYASTASTQAMTLNFDPDGKVDGANQPGSGIQMWLYYNGKLRTTGTMDANTCVNGSSCIYSPIPSDDPIWFSWN